MAKHESNHDEAGGDRKRARSIFWVGGSKGGVGKSLVTMAVVDYLHRVKQSKLHLVDCDTSNPDTWKAYRDTIAGQLINLDEADGWIQLVNTCHEHADSTVIINTAARNNAAVEQFGATLNSTLDELDRRLVVLWVINRQRDPLELLKDFMSTMPSAFVHVVRNCYFGEERKFELYNNSKIREAIEQRGGKSLTFPDLADRVADDLYSKRLAIADALSSLPIGNRAELARWRAEVQKAFVGILE